MLISSARFPTPGGCARDFRTQRAECGPDDPARALLEEIGYDELRERNREYLEFTVPDAKRAAWVLEDRCGLHDFAVREAGSIRLYSGFDRAAEYNRALVEADVPVMAMQMSEETLEDHFMKLTGNGSDEVAEIAGDAKKRG